MSFVHLLPLSVRLARLIEGKTGTNCNCTASGRLCPSNEKATAGCPSNSSIVVASEIASFCIDMESDDPYQTTSYSVGCSGNPSTAVDANRLPASTKRRLLNILTVGDGDFSCSLAIKRAYPDRIGHLVATTLLQTEKELYETYPSSSQAIIQELKNLDSEEHGRVDILFGVDATKLHQDTRIFSIIRRVDHNDTVDGDENNSDCHNCLDLIIFHYPHLGIEDAALHSSLLAHYLDSATKLLQQIGCLHGGNQELQEQQPSTSRVHLCLTNSTVKHWKLNDVVKQVGLEFHPLPIPASRSILSPWTEDNSLAFTTDNAISQVTLKDGGSRKGHWLGRYGYRHQPTLPETTTFSTNVSNSTHFFLRKQNKKEKEVEGGNKNNKYKI